MKENKMQIRNSTADFLIFTKDSGGDNIEVRVQDHQVWLTQKAIAQLFDVDRSVVVKHLKNIYSEGEVHEDSTCANFAQVAESEFEQYRVVQDKLYQSDFDRLMAAVENKEG